MVLLYGYNYIKKKVNLKKFDSINKYVCCIQVKSNKFPFNLLLKKIETYFLVNFYICLMLQTKSWLLVNKNMIELCSLS